VGHSYRDLIVWQKAKSLAVHVYRQTEGFPKAEMYGLTSQLRHAAISVVSNIAEGQARLTSGEFQQFLDTQEAPSSSLKPNLRSLVNWVFWMAESMRI
jgi:four helix bundle protein